MTVRRCRQWSTPQPSNTDPHLIPSHFTKSPGSPYFTPCGFDRFSRKSTYIGVPSAFSAGRVLARRGVPRPAVLFFGFRTAFWTQRSRRLAPRVHAARRTCRNARADPKIPAKIAALTHPSACARRAHKAVRVPLWGSPHMAENLARPLRARIQRPFVPLGPLLGGSVCSPLGFY